MSCSIDKIPPYASPFRLLPQKHLKRFERVHCDLSCSWNLCQSCCNKLKQGIDMILALGFGIRVLVLQWCWMTDSNRQTWTNQRLWTGQLTVMKTETGNSKNHLGDTDGTVTVNLLSDLVCMRGRALSQTLGQNWACKHAATYLCMSLHSLAGHIKCLEFCECQEFHKNFVLVDFFCRAVWLITSIKVHMSTIYNKLRHVSCSQATSYYSLLSLCMEIISSL